MWKTIVGWLVVLFGVCGAGMGALLLIAVVTEKEGRLNTLTASVSMMLIGFALARAGWQLRQPDAPDMPLTSSDNP